MRLQGRFIAMQMSLQHYLVDQLQTPTGIVEHAALRYVTKKEFDVKLQ